MGSAGRSVAKTSNGSAVTPHALKPIAIVAITLCIVPAFIFDPRIFKMERIGESFKKKAESQNSPIHLPRFRSRKLHFPHRRTHTLHFPSRQ